MRILRQNKTSLINVLESFVHDPLLDLQLSRPGVVSQVCLITCEVLIRMPVAAEERSYRAKRVERTESCTRTGDAARRSKESAAHNRLQAEGYSIYTGRSAR